MSDLEQLPVKGRDCELSMRTGPKLIHNTTAN
jgi:hypothetical protein